jgi:SAM-dependent methyltransferase
VTEAGVTEFFGGLASGYDAAYDAGTPNGHALRVRMARAVELLGPGPGDVLDAGMGPGRLASELDGAGWTVFGIDPTPEMVEIARRRVRGAGDRFTVAPIEALPFPDESFDAVVATGVLEYADPGHALLELARVLRPAGRAVVSYPNQSAIYGIWKTRVFYPLVRIVKRVLRRGSLGFPRGAGMVAPDEFEAMLSARGLELERLVYTSYMPVVAPLDEWVPRAAVWLCARLEGSGERLGRRLAGQIVYSARKR